ncbi:alpha/beta hydrolase [Hymenobacter armeniacus]|uniref:Phospholipase n=1 Tax=Hymenobacter armeniacus TaxID=2771358 RepID=A0ABR8JLL9_9BACT|nr:phospholipase [Hymenobacter armeniacus]MBD2720891.1 phospholipase [Hymenobacter armeniacus]
MAEHHLLVARRARYHQLGQLSARTRRVWLVCHGYGQLAQYFIRHFAFLAEADPDTVVVAPEGLSRFYLDGTSGRVGASWMTRDDRLHEIEDHVNFLNQLTGQLLAACPPEVEITVLGFSQGTATVSRWLAQATFRPAHLILWAGGFPPDLPAVAAHALLHGLRLSVVAGTADEYIDAEKLQAQLEQLRQLGGSPIVATFAGRHELNRELLARLAAK